MTLKNSSVALAAGALFVLGAAGGMVAQAAWSPTAHLTAAADTSPNKMVAAATVDEAPVIRGPIAMGTAPNYRAIFAQNHQAVVGVTTEGVSNASDDSGDSNGSGNGNGGGGGGGSDRDNPFAGTPFGQFFRGMPMPRNNVPVHGLGSGFIVRSDGLILTNAHVVDGARRVTVKLADHREFKAKVLGRDKATDVAVLKIDARDLPTVRMGDPRQLAVGDYVLAIGAPYGFEESATAGIVSAKGRSLPGDGAVPFIQTDVPVNPGNSGGPLFDSTGAVVGINSQIYSNTGGYEGVSFSIPIDVALHVKDQLVSFGKVDHARLGVVVQPINQMLANSFKLKAPSGALVSRVQPNSAASRAGIRPGDVILRCNDQELTDAGQLSALIGVARPGDKIKLEIWRDGKAQTVTAALGNATEVAAAGDNSASPAADKGRLGLAVRALTEDERRQSGIADGVVVEDVSGPAAEAGIQPGDVVLAVDGTAVHSSEQMRTLVGKDTQQVALLIQRGDARIFIPVALG